MEERQHPDERDVDAIFESIVAQWDDEAPRPEADSPAADEWPEPDPEPGSGTSTATRDDATDPPDSVTNPPWRTDRRPSGDPDPPRPGDVSPFAHAESVPWRVDPTNSVADLLGHQEHPGSADDDEGFTPPPTQPLPPLTDRLFWGALFGLVLGPLGLVWLVVFDGGILSRVIVFGLIVGGFACLVLRQPTDRGDDRDDGARV